MNLSSPDPKTISHPQDHLIQVISRWIAPLGYRIIHLELQSHRQKVLRIYIDHLHANNGRGIGIEDCVSVTKAIEEPLDTSEEITPILNGAYELEISSPGINRPLRSEDDFKNFTQQPVRIHTFRPLSSEELNNEPYFNKFPKQKNFFGILKGFHEGNVLLSISSLEKGDRNFSLKRKKTMKPGVLEGGSEDGTISLPLPLISKANLEPTIDIENKHDKE